MAETKKIDGGELVPFCAFKDGGKYKEDITVIVNGKSWRIKRGEEVMIPKYVVDVIRQSEKQDLAAANFAEDRENDYKQKSKNFE